MRKDIADEIKTECDNRGDYSQCLKHMSQESLDTYLDNLDFIESIFDKEVTDCLMVSGSTPEKATTSLTNKSHLRKESDELLHSNLPSKLTEMNHM